MIKTLRRRFIAAAMAALFLLLVILTAGITAAGTYLAGRTSENMLDMLVAQASNPLESRPWSRVPPGDDPARSLPEEARSMPFRINLREVFRVHHFSVDVDALGNPKEADLRFAFSLTQQEAADYAAQALSAEDERGKIENYRYAAVALADGGTRFVFLDNTPQTRTWQNTLAAAGGVSLAALLLMFLILLPVSGRAVAPLAQNIARQRQFVTDAGHELKTPLAILFANADALELHQGPSKYSANIRAQVQRLDGLMRHLLALSRMDEGENAFPFAPVDFSRLVEEGVSAFAEQAAQKQIALKTDIAADVTLTGSSESLALLVSVLADNAVKYADAGTTVGVCLTEQAKKIVLEITNTCQTLPDVSPQRLFDRFYRGDAARTQKDGGYGIGLSVAQAVTAMHRGQIKARYDDEHTIRFTVTLPQ